MSQNLPPRDTEHSAPQLVKESFPNPPSPLIFRESCQVKDRTPAMLPENAQTVALQALGWLAANDELFPAFLAATGVSLTDLRARAAEPTFLAAVLDFLLQEDPWVLDFCQETGLPPSDLQMARASLPGGDLPHWT